MHITNLSQRSQRTNTGLSKYLTTKSGLLLNLVEPVQFGFAYLAGKTYKSDTNNGIYANCTHNGILILSIIIIIIQVLVSSSSTKCYQSFVAHCRCSI